jgi:uncharacterized HAD superfamily protein
MKQKIGVDLDSVLAEIMRPLMGFAKENYGIRTTLNDHISYGLDEVWKTTPTRVREIVYEFYKSKEFEEMLPVNGAVEGIDDLAGRYELIVITARPFWVEDKSMAWIDKHFGGKFSKIIHSNQFSADSKKKAKSEICQEEGIWQMIDDGWEYATDCAQKGIKTILLTMPWNKDKPLHKNITRVENWQEIRKLL